MAEHKPYISSDTDMAEFTLKAMILGVIMAIVLGSANAYLGMKAGMTVSATIPAAVIAIAVFRLPILRGNVLEQNIARTSASVGEALVAGAIFTIPAFVLVNVNGQRLWKGFDYWVTTAILLIGGLLGIFFVIILRRTLCVESDLPFPESYACAEIVKSGQEGAAGASYVFGALGIGVLIQLLKDGQGLRIFKDCIDGFIKFPITKVQHTLEKKVIGSVSYQGGVPFFSPSASPALMGIGYIIGPRIATINFTGGVLAWLIFIPLVLFIDPDLPTRLTQGGTALAPADLANSIWETMIRPMAVGAMLVGSVYTLYSMRKSLWDSLKGAFSSSATLEDEPQQQKTRLDIDIPLPWIIWSSVALIIPMTGIYYYFCGSIGGALISALIMAAAGFLFCAVGGYLVGLVGGSNQPVSGLTLAVLVVSALMMSLLGVSGMAGIAAVLGVAAVVCCATCTSGDMIQDLKAGHLLGGTPWKMEIAEILTVIVVSFFLVFPIALLHQAYGIGTKELPAPQAGLMAQLSVGIMEGHMPWGLVVIGALFAIGLIMLNSPSPMLIAVGMYLPFETSFAIFVGGSIRWLYDFVVKKKELAREHQEMAERKGVLMASGFIAGEAITGIVLAVPVIFAIPSLTRLLSGKDQLDLYRDYGGLLSLIIFAVVAFALLVLPFRGGQKIEEECND